jgi:CO/xanthine dehydrogenase Mo-binding subunit
MTEDRIGMPLRRREDRRFLTGRGRYVHDIVRPQQLHAVFLRSPHAHAEIVAIEKAEALASPGAAAIFTADDVIADKLNGVPCAWGIAGKDGKPMKEPSHPLLARGKVRHLGDPVAMVIADSIEAARSAAERIGVEYRILPAVTGVVSATTTGAPQLYEDVPGNSVAIGQSVMRQQPTPPSPRPITSPKSISSTTAWCPTRWNLGLLWRSTSPRPATTPSIPRPSFLMSRGC